MNRILLSLLIVFIALAGIACVSASSDFNETVDQDIVFDINETAVPIDETETNVIEDEEDAAPVDNSTEKKDLKPVSVVNESKNQSKWQNRTSIEIPDVDVHPNKINTGNEIDDAAVYYCAYYKAFKGVESNHESIDALIALVYQSYDENDTIDIVSKVYGLVELNGITGIERTLLETNVHNYVDGRFNQLYYAPWNINQYDPDIDKMGYLGPYPPSNPRWHGDEPMA
ncbi:hypothetical protein [Methanobrevibacter sp.]|uniref:hypothetical protein n=1 Tax=Methanobrevibacter sp. TaxID=66852 RepID=UPI00388F24EA